MASSSSQDISSVEGDEPSMHSPENDESKLETDTVNQ
jgi:hypothetical protein